MKEQFVTYEISKKLKELGFNEPTIGRFSPDGEFEMYRQDVLNNPYAYKNCYPSQTLAPLWQQVVDWLREEKNMVITLFPSNDNVHKNIFSYRITGASSINFKQKEVVKESYKLMRKSAILKALELITK